MKNGQNALISICFAAAVTACGLEAPSPDEGWADDSTPDDQGGGAVDESDQDGTDMEFGGSEVTYTEEREPCADRNPLRNLYFGDLHGHSRFSLDAYTFKNWNYPLNAYLFARGGEMKLFSKVHGEEGAITARLDAPLDFAAVTDHSEFLGELAACLNTQSETYGCELCKLLRSEISGDGIWENQTVKIDPERYEEICGPDLSICMAALETTWSTIRKMADLAYDRSEACSFTTFIGYEYTGAPGGATLHRNVFFRNSNVPKRPISYYEQSTVPGLWRALEAECLDAGIGCDLLAIPHNSNLSWGHAFDFGYPEDSTVAEQKELARLRARIEPLMEIYQHKGSSECRASFTDDEACGFENRGFAPCNGDGSGFGLTCAARIDYVREILAAGLGERERIGVNPFKLGIMASTDTHNATLGAADEKAFVGHAGEQDVDTLTRLNEGFELSPGGITGVWAVENSRDALFEAMKRREVFGTSGPRISVRFFGGWDFEPDICAGNELVETGYRQGAPMGGELPERPPHRHAPVFAVRAEKDLTPLQRIQIIKVWVDETGAPKEQVFDVAGNFDGGVSVDTATCESQGPGFSTLCARWTDPDFSPEIPAAYYARVLENPTCRWSTYACNTLPEQRRPEVCDVPRLIVERAWTSPIWYEP